MMWGGGGLEEGDDKLILNELVNGKAFKDHVCFFLGGGGGGGRGAIALTAENVNCYVGS